MVFLVSMGIALVFIPKRQATAESNLRISSKPQFTMNQIIQHDGTDTSKPIYLVYEGNVYDVTAGQKYYAPGGSYHYLTGRDATGELRLFGGDIIQKKYPIVGILQK